MSMLIDGLIAVSFVVVGLAFGAWVGHKVGHYQGFMAAVVSNTNTVNEIVRRMSRMSRMEFLQAAKEIQKEKNSKNTTTKPKLSVIKTEE